MGTPDRKQNAAHQEAFRERQAKLGRKNRTLAMTDDEYQAVKGFLAQLREKESEASVKSVRRGKR